MNMQLEIAITETETQERVDSLTNLYALLAALMDKHSDYTDFLFDLCSHHTHIPVFNYLIDYTHCLDNGDIYSVPTDTTIVLNQMLNLQDRDYTVLLGSETAIAVLHNDTLVFVAEFPLYFNTKFQLIYIDEEGNEVAPSGITIERNDNETDGD